MPTQVQKRFTRDELARAERRRQLAVPAQPLQDPAELGSDDRVEHVACRHGYNVLFRRTDELLRKLRQSRLDNSRAAVMAEFCAVDVLVIDDFTLEPMSREQSRDVYEPFVERTDRASTISSGRPSAATRSAAKKRRSRCGADAVDPARLDRPAPIGHAPVFGAIDSLPWSHHPEHRVVPWGCTVAGGLVSARWPAPRRAPGVTERAFGRSAGASAQWNPMSGR